jgi:hypothetical protein
MKLSFWGQMLIYDPDVTVKTMAIVKKHLKEGKLTPACIDESYARIVQCKERLANFSWGAWQCSQASTITPTRWSTRR